MADLTEEALTTPSVQPHERERWDIVLTIILLVLNVGLAALATSLGVMLAFAGDSCGVISTCNYGQMAVGMMFAMVGPWVGFVTVAVFSIVFIVRRKRAFWLPLVGMALTIALTVLGVVLTFSAVSRMS